MIRFIVVDVGHTLGRFGGQNTVEALHALSPKPVTVVRELEHRLVQTAPVLNETLITAVCAELCIDRDRWPTRWGNAWFRPYDYTNGVLAQLAGIAPVVALSNLGVIHGPQRMLDLRTHCGRYLTDLYTSYTQRTRKPDPALWTQISHDHNVSTSDMVMIGDRWTNDVCGAINAGARAILLTGTHNPPVPVPPIQDWPAGADRITIATDLRDTPTLITTWDHTT